MDLHRYHMNLLMLQMGKIRIWDISQMVLILSNLDHQHSMHFWGPKQHFFALVSDEVLCRFYSSKAKIALLNEIFPTSHRAPKTNFVCKSYGPDKVMIQISPTCPSGNYVSPPLFKYGEIVMCGNSLQTSRSIMELVPSGFQNPKPNPNSSYQKPSKMGEEGSLFQ